MNNTMLHDFHNTLPPKRFFSSIVPVLFLIILSLYPFVKAKSEWLQLDPLTFPGAAPWSWYVSSGDGNGLCAFPDEEDTTLYWHQLIKLYDLRTGHVLWTRQIIPFDTVHYSITEMAATVDISGEVFVYVHYLGTTWTTRFDLDGTQLCPLTRYDSLHSFAINSNDIIDDSGRYFYTDGAGHLLRVHAVRGIELQIQYSTVGGYSLLASDGEGGVFIWDYGNDSTGTNRMSHVFRDGSVYGPISTRRTLAENPMPYRYNLVYMRNTRRLIQFELRSAHDSVNAYSYEIDPDSFIVRRSSHFWASPNPNTYSPAYFVASPDTVWSMFPTYLIDSLGIYHLQNFRLAALANRDTNWVLLDSFDPQLFRFTDVMRGFYYISNGSDLTLTKNILGITRRIPSTSVKMNSPRIFPKHETIVYPNPTNGSIVIHQLYGQGGQLNIVNLLGQTIATYPIFNNESSLSLQLPTNLSSGIYFLEVRQTGVPVRMFKVVLSR